MKTCSHKNCNYITFAKGLCNMHWRAQYMKPIKRKSKPNKISKKRRQQLGIYRKMRKEVLSSNPVCEARLEHCSYNANELHHIKGRISALLIDKDNVIPVCRNCHNIIETQPERAKQLGLSKSRIKEDYDI